MSATGGIGLARISPLGEGAVVVEFGDRIDRSILERVWGLARILDKCPLPGMIDCVTAYTTVTVYFDPAEIDGLAIGEALDRVLSQLESLPSELARVVEIPVCYDLEFGPDLPFVAEHNGKTVQEVVEVHSRAEYLVHLIGFAPGFPYLGGMPSSIAAPRLASPRLVVPAGSVGIAGEQTGIYPLASPGGWRLIGRTPVPLFRPREIPPSLLQPGDAVRIRPIDRAEFNRCWEESKCRSKSCDRGS